MTQKSDANARAAGARHKTIYATPSERELVVMRTFDAPRALVWAAFTDPKHIPHWNTGPEGFSMPICEIDLRPGGGWRRVWHNAKGREFSATGMYREVDPPTRIVEAMNSGDEENIATTTFAEENGRTTVTVTTRFASAAARDQAIPYAKMGTDSSYVRLDAYLASNPTT